MDQLHGASGHDALRAATRLELNIEVETVVFARYAATRTTPTISELAPCVRVIRGSERRHLGEPEVSKKDAQHVHRVLHRVQR